MKTKALAVLVISFGFTLSLFAQPNTIKKADEFLKEYNETYGKLSYELAEAEWKSNTYIVEGDTTNSGRTERANKKYAQFTGSEEVIQKTQELLQYKDNLNPIQVKQLEAILYMAANNPAVIQDVVDERIKAETKQTEDLYGYSFMMDGKEITPNEIDKMLDESDQVNERLKVWESSKGVGPGLKDGLTNLRGLRNRTVQALGYDDYFSYQVSDYGMSVDEMRTTLNQLVKDIWPLYRELHTWARYELAMKYNQPVPDQIPAHWLPNRWGQDWAALVEVEGINLDSVLEAKGDKWLIEQAERFYISCGFPPLPNSFWEKSSLYPAPDSATWKKNNHASAWHLDLKNDVRCLQSLVPNARWYETTHHELGHIYYYIAYSNPDVPLVLRGGANRAWHEGFGSLLGLAAMQKPFLEGLDLIPKGVKTDDTKVLLKEALNYIVFIPWSAGVMSEFEYSLYKEELPAAEFNTKWWELKEKYQGIKSPYPRINEKFCDACSKTHINNDAAQYYDYALSYVYLFQWHDYIAKELLKQNPNATNYFGRIEVGTFLKKMMTPGATQDSQELMKEVMGAELSAKPMLDYFAPLMDHLKEVNKGRTHSLPEEFQQ